MGTFCETILCCCWEETKSHPFGVYNLLFSFGLILFCFIIINASWEMFSNCTKCSIRNLWMNFFKIIIINSCKSYSQIILGHPLNFKRLCMVSMGIEKCFNNIQLLMLANIDFICFWNQLGEKNGDTNKTVRC
jgi:hypothetical protein